MRDYFSIGPTPSEEDCAQVGQPDYRRTAMEECQRFIERIRTTLGPEPPDAELAIKSFPHDFGSYYEVVCYYDTTNERSMRYAWKVEKKAPTRWGRN